MRPDQGGHRLLVQRQSRRAPQAGLHRIPRQRHRSAERHRGDELRQGRRHRRRQHRQRRHSGRRDKAEAEIRVHARHFRQGGWRHQLEVEPHLLGDQLRLGLRRPGAEPGGQADEVRRQDALEHHVHGRPRTGPGLHRRSPALPAVDTLQRLRAQEQGHRPDRGHGQGLDHQVRRLRPDRDQAGEHRDDYGHRTVGAEYELQDFLPDQAHDAQRPHPARLQVRQSGDPRGNRTRSQVRALLLGLFHRRRQDGSRFRNLQRDQAPGGRGLRQGRQGNEVHRQGQVHASRRSDRGILQGMEGSGGCERLQDGRHGRLHRGCRAESEFHGRDLPQGNHDRAERGPGLGVSGRARDRMGHS